MGEEALLRHKPNFSNYRPTPDGESSWISSSFHPTSYLLSCGPVSDLFLLVSNTLPDVVLNENQNDTKQSGQENDEPED